MLYINFDVYHFFKICHDFSRVFLAFYDAFCAYGPSSFRDAKTDERCPPSRRPRPRLWIMIPKLVKNPSIINHVKEKKSSKMQSISNSQKRGQKRSAN